MHRRDPHDDRVLEDLGAAECRSLLAGAGIGRLAHTSGALPAVTPVRFAVRDRSLVIATSAGSAVAAAGRGTVVAVQADSFDPDTGTGWSVTAVGTARLVRDPGEAARLAASSPAPWVPGRCPAHVVVDLGMVSGHRVRPGRAEVGDPRASTA